jgi:hypothetical protein
MKKLILPILLLTTLVSAFTRRSAERVGEPPGPYTLPACALRASAGKTGCFLDRVGNVNYVIISSSSIKLTWNPVPGAAYYRVYTYNTNTNKLISNLVVDAKTSGNTATVTGLTANVPYAVDVVPLCASGMESSL